MSRSKKIITTILSEEENNTKADGLKTKRIQLQDKADAISKQASKEYKENGHTKKFYQLSIDALKTRMEATKTQQEWYKAKGGESNSPAAKILVTSLKNYAEEIKDYQTAMAKVDKKGEGLDEAESVKELKGKTGKYRVSKYKPRGEDKEKFDTQKWDEEDKQWIMINHGKGQMDFTSAGEAEKALKAYIAKHDK